MNNSLAEVHSELISECLENKLLFKTRYDKCKVEEKCLVEMQEQSFVGYEDK